MWPFVIAGFTIFLFLMVWIVGTRWERAPRGEPWPTDGGEASRTGLRVSTPVQEWNTWWSRNLGIQRPIGMLLLVVGLWHASSPWVNRYSDAPAATTSDLVSGLALAAVGVAFIVLRGGAGLTWLAGAIGVWVLIAPTVLGYGGPSLAAHEALWCGAITIVLAVLAALERRLGQRFDRPLDRDRGPTSVGTQT
jgi:hypothetical protein